MIHSEKNERRDWTLLIFIIPIGIILIILVGQLAIRLVPTWRVDTDMNSNLEPDASSARPFALLEPILPQILTPMAWAESYLTPGAVVNFPPFLTFEPTATPSSTPNTPVDTPSPTSTSPTPVPTGTAAPTNPSSGGSGNGGGGGSTTTCQDPVADNFGGTLPCDYTSTTTCTNPSANNFGGPLPCIYPVVATLDPNDQVTPHPEIGTYPDNTGPSDSQTGYIIDGTYIVITLKVTVHPTPDGIYDLAFYEYDYNNTGIVNFDMIQIGISNSSDGSQYYEIFNWGDDDPDMNSNVGDIAQNTGTEDDNQQIPVSELYDPDGPGGAAPQTGILIDVDEAPSNPPPGEYQFVVLISPLGGSGQAAQVDAVQTVSVTP